MTFTQWLNQWHMTKIAVKAPIGELQWEPKDADREAAWELYIELLTRIATQPLSADTGDEKVALDSIYSLFPVTRTVLKNKGRQCVRFTQVAIIVLNQVVRPFTAKWHRLSIQGAFAEPERCRQFRAELEDLQKDLLTYTRMLADIAEVEDLTGLALD